MSRGILRALLLAIAFVLALAGQAAAASPRVIVVSGERSGAHEETLVALRNALAPDVGNGDIGVLDIRQIDRGALSDARIVITIGTQAANVVSARAAATPTLHMLIQRDTFEALQAGSQGERASAIFLDQPIQRQVALLTTALPGRSHLSLLAGRASEGLARKIAAAARDQQMHVNIERVGSAADIYPALERLLTEPSVLLALPDTTIFNSYTIQNVLLTSYRHRSPLVGFSPAYVRAGALLALYSTPAQMAQQAADAVRAVLAGGNLPPPQSPREFEVATNSNVARSLAIDLEPAERIAARLRQREGRP